MDRQAALILLIAGCSPALPFGEVLVEVDSEPSVAFVSRLRVDLFTPEGTWYESRDIAAPNQSDWPLSFSLYTDDKSGKSVRLRLRGYPEGGVRDFRGERFLPPPPFVDPPSAHSLDELCANPPILPPLIATRLRRAADPLTEVLPGCAPPTAAGSVAVRVEIPETALYHFEVIDADPTAAVGDRAGDTTLFLRRACADSSTEIACSDDISGNDFLSRLEVMLDPGEYFLMTGGRVHNPADLTLKWSRADQWDPSLPAVSPSPEPSADPRDQLQGGSTPDSEPQPNLTVDLITDVRVDYQKRRTAHVVLRGECLGTQADLHGGATCVETAAARAPISAASLIEGIHRSQHSAAWPAEKPPGCSVTPRTPHFDAEGGPLFDEEVCIPGGAFRLGNLTIIGLGARDATPEQPAVVDPFLLDKYEFTVARYRAALRDGFTTTDPPTANDGPLNLKASNIEDPGLCTFSTTPLDRERFPLNCVSWYTARALCQFLGGDLPTHVGWEMAAVARPDGHVIFPWGENQPDCCTAAWGRGLFSTDCQDKTLTCNGTGPVAVDALPYAKNDVSFFGVVGLGGNLTEAAIDAFEPYSSPCWWQHPLRDVGCTEREAPSRSLRGGNWAVYYVFSRAAVLGGDDPGVPSTGLGFRCSRRGMVTP
jgi:formylglycine-generating enzyme required for sulfatase activity